MAWFWVASSVVIVLGNLIAVTDGGYRKSPAACAVSAVWGALLAVWVWVVVIHG